MSIKKVRMKMNKNFEKKNNTINYNMICSQDIIEIVESNKKLLKFQEALKDVQPGSGIIEIHLYGLKKLIDELVLCRIC